MKKLFKNKFFLSAIVFLLFIGIIAGSGAIALKVIDNKYFTAFKTPLAKSEENFRMTGELFGALAEDIELVSITVIPHIKSGNVAYEFKDPNSIKQDIGALLNIYIKNNSASTLSPQIKFNNKFANEYITAQNHTMSWANTPDTRDNRAFDSERIDKTGEISGELADFIPLSKELESGKIDCYSINVVDGNLLYDGLEMEIIAGGKKASARLYADHPFINITRIMWNSSTNQKHRPDGFLYYIENTSSLPATINSVKFFDGTDNYYEHFWSPSEKSFVNTYFDSDIIASKDITGGRVLFDNFVSTQEYLVEFSITHMDRTYSIIHKTRPLVYEYDVATGWASKDVKDETFLKAITSMHFNTVIYDLNDGYLQLPEDLKNKYDILWFGGSSPDSFNYGESYVPNNPETPENDMIVGLDDVHALLPFGEPQLADSPEMYQPMRVFNKLAMFRNVPFATNVTLTHEPAFYRFAGLSDFVHYDAYRINAPFSDFWPNYYKWTKEGKYGWWFASPLETMGDYVRTLSKQSYPNRVAAWTQGATTWNIVRRLSKTEQYRYSPNPFELRMQAYLNVANGTNSLYWFNIKPGDLLYNIESSKEMQKVNREFAVIREYLSYQVPYYYERQNNFDLNANIGEDYAVMFVNDLNYKLKSSEYKYNGKRENQSFSFELPSYLQNNNTLLKITNDGIVELSFEKVDNKINFVDTVDMTGLYVFVNETQKSNIENNYLSVMEKEIFNYFDNADDLAALRALVGVAEGQEYKPASVIKENKIFATVYLWLGITGFVIMGLVATIIIVKKRRKQK